MRVDERRERPAWGDPAETRAPIRFGGVLEAQLSSTEGRRILSNLSVANTRAARMSSRSRSFAQPAGETLEDVAHGDAQVAKPRLPGKHAGFDSDPRSLVHARARRAARRDRLRVGRWPCAAGSTLDPTPRDLRLCSQIWWLTRSRPGSDSRRLHHRLPIPPSGDRYRARFVPRARPRAHPRLVQQPSAFG